MLVFLGLSPSFLAATNGKKENQTERQERRTRKSKRILENLDFVQESVHLPERAWFHWTN